MINNTQTQKNNPLGRGNLLELWEGAFIYFCAQQLKLPKSSDVSKSLMGFTYKPHPLLSLQK